MQPMLSYFESKRGITVMHDRDRLSGVLGRVPDLAADRCTWGAGTCSVSVWVSAGEPAK